eukprot:SAG11_NODE_1222_length_5484_cov_7.843268_1_plen_73_part_10
MDAMMSLQNIFNYSIRYGYPYLIPFIVSEYGLNEAQRSLLLCAFTPGYIIPQVGLCRCRCRRRRRRRCCKWT